MSAAIEVVNEVREIALGLLRANLKNPRQTMDEAALGELAASIREHGILAPLTVRPIHFDCMDGDTVSADRQPDGYEIVCGHRRADAATMAGLTAVPCIARVMDDATAAEIALIDNLQRVDVPAIEEAEAFGELLERLGSIPAVAAKVGKEQAYVAKRLRLRTLTAWSRDALREQLVTIDHALLLARLAEAEQNEALKWCLDPRAGAKTPVHEVLKARLESRNRNAHEDDDDTDQAGRRARWRREWEAESVQRLKEHIECTSGQPLDRAPWPIEEDWLLPDAGSCLDCPKNTKANAPLFGDLDMGVAVCTDGACFKAKTRAFVLHGMEAARKATDGRLPVIQVSWKATSKEPRMTIGEPCDGSVGLNNFTNVPKPGQIFKAGQWVETKKKCPFVCPAVTTDWSDANNRGYMGGDGKLRKPGEIVQACIAPKCKVHPKAYGKSAPANAASSAKNEKQEQARRARFEAFVAAEKPVRRALYDAVLAAIKPEIVKRNLLLSNSRQWRYPICVADGFDADDWTKGQNHVDALVVKATAAQLDALLFHATFGQSLVVDGNAVHAKDKGRGRLRELAKVAGVDAAAIERKFDKAEKVKAAPAKKASAKPAAKKAAKKVAKKPAKKAGRK